MTLSAILAVSLLSLNPASSGNPGALLVTASNASIFESQAGGPSQEPPAQPRSTSKPDSANQPKPAPKPHHRKKTSTPNCSTTAPAASSAEKTASTPCPPPKKVVRKGGSDEPPVQFTGGTSAEQALHQRSTNQLNVATEENLKEIAGHQLNPSQQEMVSQINQFMEQSKTAAAAGDLDRAHNLALKAHLLSVELLKP
jgi:hypothetical protein